MPWKAVLIGGAAVLGGIFLIEHSHRIVLDAPVQAEIRVAETPCPDNDDQPYTARCLAFLQGAAGDGAQWRIEETPAPARSLSSVMPLSSGQPSR
jgi:hypothetical protein